MDIGVTPNHRMVIQRMKGSSRNKTKHWSDKTEIVLANDLKVHRDNRFFMSGKTSIESNLLSDEERLMIAYQADGRKDTRCDTMRFRFKKIRKIDRLKQLLDRMGNRYTEKIEESSGVVNIYVYGASNLKQFDFSWVDISKVSYQWCIQFLEEVSHWDSSIRDLDTFNYSSIKRININKIQEIAVLCGKRTRVHTYENREGNRKDLYNISITGKPQIQGDAVEIYEESYNGIVYCAVVPKGRLVVSYNDRTLICGNTRRGAFAAYLDIDHPDIEEFLNIKDIGSPIQNLFNAVCVPDYWMQDMIDGDEEKRKIWARVLESRQQKGLPYIFFTDNVNKGKPQVYKDKNMSINASNLCSEIALPSNIDESFVCCLASMNLELYDEWKDTEAVKLAIYFLDAVMSEFIEKTEDNHFLRSAHNFAKRHRALGLGVMGWHSYLQLKNVPFGGLRSHGYNHEIFSNIQKKATEASKELANIYGEPEVLEGYGLRNTTLLAIAPTTSSSSIMGQVSPGIEPFSSNYYKAGLAKGNFMRKNKYLEALLKEKNLDTEDTWRQIMLNHGSVQGIEGLTQDEKDVFKTFKEISQADVILQAANRQKFIDQSQSLNLMIPSTLPIRDVNNLIIDAWKQGVKTLYYQRSSSVSKEMLTNIINCSSCDA